jgi:hypothetical protein
VAASFGDEAAVLGDDVARRAARDLADVRRRLVVQPPQPQIGDRSRRGGDRRAALLRVHAGVRGPAAKRHVQLALVRGTEDHLADRPRVVVDVADPRVQAMLVEGRRAPEPDLLHRREEELDAGVAATVLEHARCGLEHRRDGRLVVRAEDRPSRVAHDRVLADLGLDRPLGRDGVEVRAEEDRQPRCAVTRLDPAVDVPDRRADPRPRVVLESLEPERLHVLEHPVGDSPLLPRRARKRRQLEEQRKHVRGPSGSHRPDVRGSATP